MRAETVIERGGGGAQYWRDVWQFRELFWLLAWRDLLVRYKQTAVGAAWAVLRPLLSMAALVLVFGAVAKLPSGGAPYPLLVLAGVLPWQFFSTALAESGNSLVNNSNLVSKVYFPRMVVPASAVITSLADLAIAGVLLLAALLAYGVAPGANIIFLPLFVMVVVAMALGAALWVSALTVRYRDVRFVIPFVVQFGFFLSPVGYAASAVPEHLRALWMLNPMTGVIEGFRWALLPGTGPLNVAASGISVCAALGLLLTGAAYFRRAERGFADAI